jgi:hypothetical protein
LLHNNLKLKLYHLFFEYIIATFSLIALRV